MFPLPNSQQMGIANKDCLRKTRGDSRSIVRR